MNGFLKRLLKSPLLYGTILGATVGFYLFKPRPPVLYAMQCVHMQTISFEIDNVEIRYVEGSGVINLTREGQPATYRIRDGELCYWITVEGEQQ